LLKSDDEEWGVVTVFFDEEGRFLRATRLSDGEDVSARAVFIGLDRIAREAIIDHIHGADYVEFLAEEAERIFGDYEYESELPTGPIDTANASVVLWKTSAREDEKRFFAERIARDQTNGLPDPALEELLYQRLFVEGAVEPWAEALCRLFPQKPIPRFSRVILTPGRPDGDGDLIFTGFEQMPGLTVVAASVPWTHLVLEAGLLCSIDKPETADQYARAAARVESTAADSEKQAAALLSQLRNAQ
jgi:hypothetical protein